MFLRVLKNSLSNTKIARQRRHKEPFRSHHWHYEALEHRCMLAGDGIAAITEAAGTANICGDESVNAAESTSFTETVTSSSNSTRQVRGKKATFSISDAVVSEPVTGTFDAQFTVVRSGDTTTAASVSYRTVDGTATAPDDYEASSLTKLSFAPGESAKSVAVTVYADASAEPEEVFYVELSNPENASIKDGQGQGTIWDTNTNATSVFVSNIGVITEKRGHQFVIDVRDEHGNAVSGVNLAVKLSDPSVPEGDHDHIIRQWVGTTDASGRMTTSLLRNLDPGKTYNVEVVDVYLDGYAWSPQDSPYDLDGDDDDIFPEHDFAAGDASTY